MKTVKLPALMLGTDVLTAETSLTGGAVRSAQNITMTDDGAFSRRPSAVLATPYSGLHSLWASPAGMLYAAAGTDLLRVDAATGGISVLWTGLPYDERVSFCDVNGETYVAAPGVLRKIDVAGTVRVPGIRDLLGDRPALSATTGSLTPGTYGVGYTLVTATGEESAMSSISWITLSATGGIHAGMLAYTDEVVAHRLYATPPNGERLYLNREAPLGQSLDITDNVQKQDGELRRHRSPLPGGRIVRYYRGRIYVAFGSTVFVSDPYAHFYDIYGGWLQFDHEVTLLEPVLGGIYVGTTKEVVFLDGPEPGSFKLAVVSPRGAYAGTGCQLPADWLDGRLANDRAHPPVAWLSDVGMVIGLPDGSVHSPQAERIRMTATGGSVATLVQNGLRQVLFPLESMAIGVGGAVDTTL
jgi:hypothetical protein